MALRDLQAQAWRWPSTLLGLLRIPGGVMILAGNWHHREPEHPSAIARRCSHPHCRTSLDEYPVECPHGLPFCAHCTWEEVCPECAA